MNSLKPIRKNEIQVLANGLREDCELSEDDIVGNIAELIKEIGYEYTEETFADNTCSGFTQAIEGAAQFRIGFNSNNLFTETYKRFTLGHELGHATIPEHTEILRTGLPHYSNPEFQNTDHIELEADHFSICFLAPQSQFKKVADNKEFTLEDIEQVAEHFKISIYATALRFLELTELACSLIIGDSNSGNIRYEKRSDALKNLIRTDFLYRSKVNTGTYTHNAFKDRQSIYSRSIRLQEWYPDIPNSVEAYESVFFLPYNNTTLTFLLPLSDDFEQESEEQEDIFLRRS